MGAEYVECERCGFVFSKTCAEMTDEHWVQLNRQFHSNYQGADTDPNDLNWTRRLNAQAAVIADLRDLGLISTNQQWLDYGCGDGKLSCLLNDRYSLKLGKYDRYMTRDNGYLPDDALKPHQFGFVISTSVLEHLRTRAQIDAIPMLVAEHGVMGIHTLVTERVPRDPNWFYFLPVHCSFFTNMSMEILFNSWGYTASIYNIEAKLWVCFKEDISKIECIIREANLRPGRERLRYHFKRGFMDYWKLDAASVMKRAKGEA
jgi:hypothetical protein